MNELITYIIMSLGILVGSDSSEQKDDIETETQVESHIGDPPPSEEAEDEITSNR